MATELLDELMRRSAELTAQEKQRLARFLSEGTVPAKTATTEPSKAANSPGSSELHSKKREQHSAWLKAHREEYSGQYVALDGDKLMGHGRTIAEATALANANGCDTPFIVFVLSSQVVADGGL
jgi:uncharacterized protein YciI